MWLQHLTTPFKFLFVHVVHASKNHDRFSDTVTTFTQTPFIQLALQLKLATKTTSANDRSGLIN